MSTLPHGGRRTTWVEVPARSVFGIDALPYGVFSTGGRQRVGVRIGEQVLDVGAVASRLGIEQSALAGESLDTLLAAGRARWDGVRAWLTDVLCDPNHRADVEQHLLPLADVTMHAPFTVADYVDFYSSEHHASNVGRMFRPDAAPLHPSWKNLPVAYHGRAGTVVVSGTDVVRPCGLRRTPGRDAPSFGPTARLDIEAEVGFVVGTGSRMGTRVPSSALAEHVFGVVLVNDWSARDIQAYEYVPLGPFLGKSFATSISAWVLPLAALDHARVTPPRRDVPPASYLADGDEPWGLDIDLEIAWNTTVVARPPYASTYWTPAQQLAHMTVNGASLRTGDLFASGTVSGPERGQRGSFLELSWNGTEQVRLADSSLRTFLEDGDSVTITGTAPGAGGARIGLGDVTGRVLPSLMA